MYPYKHLGQEIDESRQAKDRGRGEAPTPRDSSDAEENRRIQSQHQREPEIPEKPGELVLRGQEGLTITHVQRVDRISPFGFLAIFVRKPRGSK